MMLLIGIGCAPTAEVVITVPEEQAEAFADFVYFLKDDRVSLRVDGERGRASVVEIAVAPGPPCAECFALSLDEEGGGGRVVVAAGDLLGAQYGVAAALEAMGWRFLHPARPLAPEEIPAAEDLSLPGGAQAPAVARRGIHLHTLHPIEGLEAFWRGEEDAEDEEARRILDWLIKNRGDHLQWVGLDDISGDAAVLEAWRARTARRIGHAHRRGVTAGVGLQLYGTSNLQRGFDLIDRPGEDEAGQVAERLAQLTDGLPWDVLNLSFGEFSGEAPQAFIDSVDLAYGAMQAAIPGVDVPATIHVGDYPDLRVQYNGEELLYYFLVKYADPGIRPWIHTVMYYDLFEDAGGAYAHEEFDEHRAFLEERIATGEPVGYFPESAYWVAFDNPVPLYLPLYARSRLLDLQRLPGLADHVVFSSGWEWGYWQGDLAGLRGAWGMYGADDPAGDPAEATAAFFADMYGPAGGAGSGVGADLAAVAAAITEIQHRYLLIGRLAPWMAGRDAFMDAAREVVAQPDRATEEEILAMAAADRAAFLTGVVEPLEAMAAEVEAQGALIPGAGGLPDGWRRMVEEVRDGAAVDAARARFAAARLRALLAGAARSAGELSEAEAGTLIAARLAEAADHLAAGRAAVARRHADLQDPDGGRWTAEAWDNGTIYRFGYLLRADQLCFWERERVQAERALLQSQDVIPACAI